MKWVFGGIAAFFALACLAGAVGAAGAPGAQPIGNGACGWSPFAQKDVPQNYLALYASAASAEGIDCSILAGIGKVETDHGRSNAPGVKSGVNSFGCCAGPMQFDIRNGPPSTWDSYGLGSPYDPANAIPAAAKYLKANGAPGDYHRAILAYNHSEQYVADVNGWADRYRGTAVGIGGTIDAASAADVLNNPRITWMNPALERGDIATGQIDPRIIATMAWIAQRHTFLVSALKSDHSFYTVNGSISNHSAGRAVDIASVDGEICTGTRSGTCGRLAVDLAHITGPMRSTELIYCFDPDGPADPRGFARADHCNHVHVGFDA